MDRAIFPLGFALIVLLMPTNQAHASPTPENLPVTVLARDGGTLPPDAGTKEDAIQEDGGDRGTVNCPAKGPVAWTPSERAEPWFGSLAMALLLAGMVLTRWFKISKPNHNFLLVHIESLKRQVEAYVTDQEGAEQLRCKLQYCQSRYGGSVAGERETKPAAQTSKEEASKTGAFGTLWNRLSQFAFWSQSAENATWLMLHDIEAELALWLPQDNVRARLITAEPNLRGIGTDAAKALAAAIGDELRKSPSDEAHVDATQERAVLKSAPFQNQLLNQAMAIIFDDRDQRFIALTDWQNKSTWLALVSSILMVVIGAVEGNIMLFVAGAAGGLLSRMMRAIRQPTFSSDYGASWNTLFLSPLFGALSAWFGIGLITVLANPGVAALGPFFKLVQWERPLMLSTLATAFLLGFTERVFDSLTDAVHAGDAKADSTKS
jgi:hypothetical protein